MATEGEDPPREALMARLFRHGGDLRSAAALFPDAPGPWIDLSTGINPVAYPADVSPRAWERLPEPGLVEALLSAAASRYGAGADCVAAGPGTQALIQWLPRLFPARRVAVVGSTYAEHERSWLAGGAVVDVVPDISDVGDREVVVVVNPNNPDGRLYRRAALQDLADRLDRRDGLLIVDEAFMDFEDESLAPDLRRSIVVLRSFGKAYGLAGLRLGFALAPPDRALLMRRALGPWAVSGPAIEIGRRALLDRQWLEATRRRLRDDGAWFDGALARAGFQAIGGNALFRLVRHPRARERFSRLCEGGVLTRPFAGHPEWLRFGVPPPSLRARLSETLSQCALDKS
ncbi:L-threonine O-3-phosphate decarboxylase [Roseiarcus fermentans]|uniref:threonine-phosphate decarboxylase n=1 Tax=Roseiarcus fermentans TaxID=1473586 RepID=A0A366EKF0_9HYPH|nr:threonine-phosphate decarboxylase CobD [Roseiarcus fermentans]RBP02863.1 L-threonine O-3-phosphate decarboxylase [Roseiarcus fermentans]